MSNWKRLAGKIGAKKLGKGIGSTKRVKGSKNGNPVNTLTQQAKSTDAKLNSKLAVGTAIELTLWSNDPFTKLCQPAPLVPDGRKTELGRYLAMDCEFVGVGEDRKELALARVTIVNFYGHVVYDEYVKPREKVTDWRTWVSGVAPHHMAKAVTFEAAQAKVSEILDNRILIGHAVQHDLDSLFLSHPKSMVRDTSKLPEFRGISGGKPPALKKLMKHFLNCNIQVGTHCPLEDARATMLLFRLKKREFENKT